MSDRGFVTPGQARAWGTTQPTELRIEAQYQARRLLGNPLALTAVLLAQPTRELALLGCVGATGRQIRRSVLGEGLLTGVAASALGARPSRRPDRLRGESSPASTAEAGLDRRGERSERVLP